MFYTMNIAGVERDLPLCKVTDDLYIAAFICFGDAEVTEAYEHNTGKVIAETVGDAEAIPAVLVKNHGVFTWGPTPEKAVENAVTVEEVAKMALLTEQLAPDTVRIEQYLLDKHYFRKHGKDAYYGQK